MLNIANSIFTFRDFIWSGPIIILLLGTSVFLTCFLNGIQFRYFFLAFKKAFSPNKLGEGDLSPFQSLMTAVAGAIGTGSIAGIATAVTTGGIGALFWMWVVAFFGMATTYSETLLGLKFKQINKEGEVAGGPMYFLRHGLNAKVAAYCFAFLGVISTFGFCLVQSNSVVDAVVDMYSYSRLPLGIGLAVIAGLVVIGGVKSIGRVAGIVVPFMAATYLVVGLIILGVHYDRILPAFHLIIKSAFYGQAAVGGFLGSTIMLALQNGAQFGVFANESGLGSFSIAGACSKNEFPVEQGLISITGVFLTTMVVCTITGLVLAVTQVVGIESGGKLITGSPLAIAAFGSVHDGFRYVVLFGLIFFAFTTILAWAYYGEKCIEYLFGLKLAHIYRWCYILVIVLGALLELEVVWAIAHLTNAFMAIPNLYGLIRLSPLIKTETKKYLQTQLV